MAEDWHTKVAFLKIIWKYFYSERSASEHGTMYQIRNKLHRINVVKSPKNDVNACEDFIEIVTAGHIVASSLAALKLKSKDDTPADDILPNAKDVWFKSHEERKKCLMQLCEVVYDKFVCFSYNDLNCDLKACSKRDGVFSYSTELLRLGCFYLEFSDAIREGDGERVLRCWKYLMPVFFGSGSKNYCCESVNLRFQHLYTLSPRLSAQLIWSRFINMHGKPGMNIAGDLHMEHLNKIAKICIRVQGVNRTANAIQRTGKAIGTISPLLDQFDEDNSISLSSSRQAKPDTQRDIEIVVEELVKSRGFVVEENRKHLTFPRVRNVLHARTKDELMTWILSKLPNEF